MARLAAAALWLWASALALAAEAPPLAPWERAPLAADPKAVLAAAAGPAPEGAGTEVVFSEQTAEFDAEGRLVRTVHIVFRQLGATPASGWDGITTRWEPWHEARPVVEARVVGADGSVHLLDPATVTEGAVASDQSSEFYDARSLRAPLPALFQGSVVEVRTTVRERTPLFRGGYFGSYVFGFDAPARLDRLRLKAPASLPLRAEATGLTALPRRSVHDGTQEIVYEAGPLDAVQRGEPYSPRNAPPGLQVSFSTGRSWSELARGYAAQVDRQLAAGPLARGVGPPAGPSGDRVAIAQRALDWLHATVRYTGVELGEAAIVPRPPAETVARGYGDCKDMAALLVALLRRAGLRADVALVRSGWYDAPDDLPGLELFDHAIVHVGGEPELWIDPTDPDAVVGLLSSGDQGHQALVAARGTRGVVRLPAGGPEANRRIARRSVTLAEWGPAAVLDQESNWGLLAENQRALLGKNADAARDKLVDRVKGWSGAASISDAEVDDPRLAGAPARTSARASGASIGSTLSSGAYCSVSAARIFSLLPQELLSPAPSPRRTPFVVPFAFRAELTYDVVPPSGFEIHVLPEPVTKVFGPVRYDRTAARGTGGEVIVRLALEAGPGPLSPDEVAALQGYVQTDVSNALLLSFDDLATRALGDGEIKQALGIVRGRIAAHPTEALHHAQLARVLLAAGAGELARAEARRATELEPGFAWAQRTLGWILQFDLVGRQRRPGFDPAGAAAAYRRAIALDPKDVGVRMDLAQLLLVNDQGERYGRGAHLDEAIAVYRGIKQDLKADDADDDYADALARAGKVTELAALLPSLRDTPKRRALQVAVAAATHGEADALDEAARAGDDAARRSALALASIQLAAWRDYARSAALLGEAARGGSEETKVAPVIELFERLARPPPAARSDDGTSALVAELLTAVLGQAGPDVPRLKALFARRPWIQLDAEGGAPSIEAMLGNVRQFGLTEQNVLDMALAAPRISDGNDRLGRRTRLELPGSKLAFYSVHEDGKDLVLAVGGGQGSDLAQEALRRADGGDLAGAHQWLAWADEVVPEDAADDLRSPCLFAYLWKKGVPPDRPALRVAAASLVALGKMPAAALPILEEERGRAPPEERAKIDWSLATAALTLEKDEVLLAALGRLAADSPDSVDVFQLRSWALRRRKRFAEAVAMARQRLDRQPADAPAMEELMLAAAEQGDFDGAEQWGRRAVKTGRASATASNNLAWYALFRNGDLATAALDAKTATEESDHPRANRLNTLAAVQAELGEAAAAHRTLLRSLDAADTAELSPAAWYVLGRVQEDYGLPEAAIADYRRVTVPAGAAPDDVSHLAARRLKALGASR
ncbi:MAG TPA: DUF3857 domain-containing protein [Myxococcales bacterium]|nr:DUF3857 domain-containing protein [Myxococcales bacterium]